MFTACCQAVTVWCENSSTHRPPLGLGIAMTATQSGGSHQFEVSDVVSGMRQTIRRRVMPNELIRGSKGLSLDEQGVNAQRKGGSKAEGVSWEEYRRMPKTGMIRPSKRRWWTAIEGSTGAAGLLRTLVIATDTMFILAGKERDVMLLWARFHLIIIIHSFSTRASSSLQGALLYPSRGDA